MIELKTKVSNEENVEDDDEIGESGESDESDESDTEELPGEVSWGRLNRELNTG